MDKTGVSEVGAGRAADLEPIEAEDIRSALLKKADEPNDQRQTNGQADPPERVYKLSRRRVIGPLILGHHIISKAVDIQDCVFEDEVDLSYCKFEQTVNLSNCTFESKINSGNEAEAFTVYERDLICNGATFLADACFAGARVEGDAHFTNATFKDGARNAGSASKADFSAFRCAGYGHFKKARFENKKRTTTFEHAYFARSLVCTSAKFEGEASFHGLRCGTSAFFRDARFEGQRNVRFDYAFLGSNLRCENAEFGTTVTFESVKCGGSLYLDRATFHSVSNPDPRDREMPLTTSPCVDLRRSCFGGRLSCIETTFSGSVDIGGVECTGDAWLRNCKFLGTDQPSDEEKIASKGYSTTFRGASFGKRLFCDGATFAGPVSFSAMKSERYASFEGAKFESISEETPNSYSNTFTAATFGGQLNCKHAEFEGKLSFNAVRCKGSAWFDNAKFRGKESDFTGASFERQLVCKDAVFEQSVSFNSIMCTNSAFFTKAQFKNGKHNFSHARFNLNLYCGEAVFEGEVINFQLMHVGGSFVLTRAYVDTVAKLGHTCILNKLSLDGSCFKKEVELFDTSIKILELLDANLPGTKSIKVRVGAKFTSHSNDYVTLVENGDELERVFGSAGCECKRQRVVNGLYPFVPGKINLADTKFERFHAGPNPRLQHELAKELADGQDPKTFSRHPYVQLERFYENEGDKAAARRMYYRGRVAYRKQAKKGKGGANWNRGISALDLLWR